jgi:7-carboxy-7-deazaguanine synthase
MAKLFLSEDGVFPIIKDHNGNLLKDELGTDLQVAGTIQGEGKLVGVPSLFVRLAGCNLRCQWNLSDGGISTCDTSYANDGTGFSTWHEVKEVVDVVINNLDNIRHVVITGGEPLLQKDSLIEFCRLLKSKKNIHITIETNGTIEAGPLDEFIDLYSVSPKLSNAVVVKSGQLPLYDVQSFIDSVRRSSNKDLQIKFVVSDYSEEDKIKNFLDKFINWNDEDIMIMPAGTTNEILHRSSKPALAIAVKNGWRFTSRLHITLFGDKRKV